MKAKHKAKGQAQLVRPAAAPSHGTGRKRLLFVLLTLGVAVGTWALFEFVVWNKIPSELVGKWVVVDGPREYADATFDFHRSGAMQAIVNLQGKQGTIDATIRVEGKTIFSTSRRPTTGEVRTTIQVIRSLTPTELVVEDEQGKLMKMKRVD